MGNPKIEISIITRDKILTLNKAKKSQQKIADELGIPRSRVQRVLAESEGRITASEKQKLKNQEEARSRRRTKREIEAKVQQIVKEKYIDVLVAVRSAINDMQTLNMEQSNAIPEIIELATDVNARLKEVESLDNDQSLINASDKALSTITNFYSRARVRIDTQDQLGKWIDRYAKLLAHEQTIEYFEKIVNGLFEGINHLDEKNYQMVRKVSIEHCEYIEKYFEENEVIPDSEIVNS